MTTSHTASDHSFDYDFIIIGSGFGGSVSALRLVEKGYSVCVLEQGKRYRPEDFPKTNWNLRKFLWTPRLRCFGIQQLRLFRHLFILAGAGVGGGSLVYAATLLDPPTEFYEAPEWKALASWKQELAPFFKRAKKMLGVTKTPSLADADSLLLDYAKSLSKENSFEPTEVGIYFNQNTQLHPDPFFQGQGPKRAGCRLCGGCMVGCRYHAKNTLDQNYLYLAEKKGACIQPEKKVLKIFPFQEGYRLEIVSSTKWFPKKTYLTTKKVVLAAGVLGTLELLFHSKKDPNALPKISNQLGKKIRTNSEALLGVLEPARTSRDHSQGIAISASIAPDEHTHIETVRYPKGSDFMRTITFPLLEGKNIFIKFIYFFKKYLLHPISFFKTLFATCWTKRTFILLTMQKTNWDLSFIWKRGFPYLKKRLHTQAATAPPPVPIPEGVHATKYLAKKTQGIALASLPETIFGKSTTAHILGGCVIGANDKKGVINSQHEVFHYPGLYVCDGSIIPANLGVNPSLTITALSERAMSLIPNKDSNKSF